MGIPAYHANGAHASAGDYIDDRYDSFSDDCTECAQLAAAAGVRCPKGSICVSSRNGPLFTYSAPNVNWPFQICHVCVNFEGLKVQTPITAQILINTCYFFVRWRYIDKISSRLKVSNSRL